jgi:uncharacterized tannase-like protein DUF6351
VTLTASIDRNGHSDRRARRERSDMNRYSALAAVSAVAFLCWCVAGSPAAADSATFRIRAFSNRPDLVSGGDVLARIDVPAGVPLADVRVARDGANVTGMLRAADDGHALVGVITGLPNGASTLTAGRRGVRNAIARLAIVNHPIAGPVFAGPKEAPFICETQNFTLLSGGTLGPPLDDQCSVATRVDYVYRSKSGGALKPLGDPARAPADVAETKTLAGETVRYIVRIETGTIDRAIYQIAILHDPAAERPPDVLRRPAGWNRRLIFTFGGGCIGGWYHQATTTGGVDDDVMLRQGYAVASSSLNVAGNNCDSVLAAETTMMVKERFIEGYGVPLFTIGWGCSGGSYQQTEIADSYPGLLDGIIPGCSFPDMTHALTTTTSDSRLLWHYFTSTAKAAFSEEQQKKIGGYVSVANIVDGFTVRAARINATETCPPVLAAPLRYDAVGNPKGARCDIYDHAVNVYGRDPATGFARRPLDNVGIQYGLAVLHAGGITAQQFLDLNEQIGGYDADGNFSARRSVADPQAVRAAYRTGRVTSGGGGLASIPIIDYRAYADDAPGGDPHLRYHSFSMRARLQKANGSVDNHVMLVEDRRYGLYSSASPLLQDALRQMDRWLTALSEDASADAQAVKVRRAKPADLADACWTRDERPRKIAEPQVYGSGRCDAIYPSASFPRGVAGAPVAADVITCQLKPIDPAEYTVAFGPDEIARLKRIFPGGVCDWSKPGIDQQRMTSTWHTFMPPAKNESSQSSR